LAIVLSVHLLAIVLSVHLLAIVLSVHLLAIVLSVHLWCTPSDYPFWCLQIFLSFLIVMYAFKWFSCFKSFGTGKINLKLRQMYKSLLFNFDSLPVFVGVLFTQCHLIAMKGSISKIILPGRIYCKYPVKCDHTRPWATFPAGITSFVIILFS
jgi:hypothetical protein